MFRQAPHKTNKLSHGIITLLVSAGLAQGITAQTVDNRSSIYLGGSWFEMDSKRGVDDDDGFYLGGEHPLSERWSGTIEMWQNDADLHHQPGYSDNRYVRAGGNYHLNLHSRWQPYLAVGIGHMETEFDYASTAGNTALDFGVGVKRFIGDNFFLRGDAKMLLGEGGADDFLFGISIGYAFGSSGAARSAPSPEPMDSDGDGVIDERDLCPDTPPGTEVNSQGCALETEIDSDGDGVVDSRDRCPETDPRHAVDSSGCVIMDTVEMQEDIQVNFGFDEDEIAPRYNSAIRNFADFMNQHGNSRTVIEGHTDNTGPAEYNQSLSERRAQVVVDALVNDYDIDVERLSAVGYGETRPVADNATPEGRAQNRRTVGVIEVEVERARERED